MTEKIYSVLEILRLTTDHFIKKNISEPRLNAEMLLCHILKCDRMKLYLDFDKPLQSSELNEYRELIKRRQTDEPLQYITGVAPFYRSEFIVNKSVLIPRAETEILVEEFLKDILTGTELYNIYEIGSGSGCIAVSVAKELKLAGKNFTLTSIDISDDAIQVAKENQMKILGEEIVTFEKKDIFLLEQLDGKYQYIISNPPYISKNEFMQLDKVVKDHEPSIALTDDNDGLQFYKKIIEISAKNDHEVKRKIYFEIAYNAKEKLEKLLSDENISDYKFIKDHSGNYRVLIVKL